MAREGDTDVAPPRSVLDHDEYRSKASDIARNAILSPTPRSHSDALHDLAGSPVNYDGINKSGLDDYDEDASSNVQEHSEAETPVLPVVSHISLYLLDAE